MYLMIMRRSMSGAIHGYIPEDDVAKKFLDAIGQKFKEFDKAQTGIDK